MCRALLAGLALALGLGLVCVDAAAKAVPGQGRFTLAPRSNTSSEPSLGCGVTVNWPGSQFADSQWTYAPYDCSEYWTYTYTVNVTARPSRFYWNEVAQGFQVSSVTISNTGWLAGFDYNVTAYWPIVNDAWLSCSGMLKVGDPSVTCQLPTVPGILEEALGYYTASVEIHNRNWVSSAEGSIAVTQLCTDGTPAGADLCSNGTFYGFLATQSSPPLLGYVTGGCVSGMAPGANCGAASFCCPDGAWPANTTSCGSGDGTTDSPCYDCTGGC